MEKKKKGFQFSRDEIIKSDEKVRVKLPSDWFRFWNQFEH